MTTLVANRSYVDELERKKTFAPLQSLANVLIDYSKKKIFINLKNFFT